MDQENTTVGELGEDALVARLTKSLSSDPRVVVGPGDDCAVTDSGGEDWELLKTDCLIEGVHFLPGTDPKKVGQKALKRVLSDIAAMGGAPGEAVVTLAVDADRAVEEVTGWYEGIKEVAMEFGCAIVGGETARLPGTSALLSVAMTGRVRPEHCVRRSGAKVGDLILVTGQLGGSFESERHLTFTPRLAEASWLVENFLPSAMMDLSDGLGSDLPRLALASGIGYSVSEERIPTHDGVTRKNAISDGEDYELLFTIEPVRVGALIASWGKRYPDLPLTVIGEMTEETPEELAEGWQHYRGE